MIGLLAYRGVKKYRAHRAEKRAQHDGESENNDGESSLTPNLEHFGGENHSSYFENDVNSQHSSRHSHGQASSANASSQYRHSTASNSSQTFQHARNSGIDPNTGRPYEYIPGQTPPTRTAPNLSRRPQHWRRPDVEGEAPPPSYEQAVADQSSQSRPWGGRQQQQHHNQQFQSPQHQPQQYQPPPQSQHQYQRAHLMPEINHSMPAPSNMSADGTHVNPGASFGGSLDRGTDFPMQQAVHLEPFVVPEKSPRPASPRPIRVDPPSQPPQQQPQPSLSRRNSDDRQSRDGDAGDEDRQMSELATVVSAPDDAYGYRTRQRRDSTVDSPVSPVDP